MDAAPCIKEELDVPCKMRDGTILRADIYRPTGGGQVPVLLCRTPYGKTEPNYVNAARAITSRGYIAAVQDVRGRHASDGEYAWMFGRAGNVINADDGYDSVEWAARVAGSDGRVGVWGNSYPSALAWRLAGTQPPSLAAMFTSGMVARQTDMTFGLFETGRRLQWVYNMAADARRRSGAQYGPHERTTADDIWTRVERGKWIWRLPLSSIPDEVFSTLAPQLKTLYAEAHEDLWAFDQVHSKVNVPVSCVTGWWDRLVGTVNNYSGMVAKGPADLRSRHRLVIGPWGHEAENYSGRIGPNDYGPQANAAYADMLVRFFDHELKEIDNGLGSEPPVKVFVLNENSWRYFDTWPPPTVRDTSFFLSGGGNANTPRGDGSLVPEPVNSPPDRYTYDPADPVMSLMNISSQAAPCDQSPLDHRADVLVYQTPPLKEDLVFIGPVVCELWISSNAPDTDFTAKLVEVGPNGMATNLSYGIVRASLRNAPHAARPLEGDEVIALTIRMMPVGIRFRKGSRVRLDISSSDFPNFDRNHNTGGAYWSDAELRVAKQTVFHNLEHPSRLLLPCVAD